MMHPNTIAVACLVKQAGPTYDYTASKRLNYYPEAPKEKVRAIQEGNIGRILQVKKSPVKGNAFNEWGVNKKELDNSFPLSKFYLHSFEPTVSGTGNGPRFWQPQHNPYE